MTKPTSPINPKPIPKPPTLNQDQDIRPFYKVSEHVLKTQREDVPYLSMFGVPITEMNTDELQCLLVMVARQADYLTQQVKALQDELSKYNTNATTTKP